MSQRSDQSVLLDIHKAGRQLVSYIENMDYESFRADIKTQAAVQYEIMIIGEAAKLLSPELRSSLASVPWNKIARMRDRLIHGYATVDLNVVWDTASESVPALMRAIDAFLPDTTE